jgi:glutathione S-transferase
MALFYAGIEVELREVLLRDKPMDMLRVSQKGTVPVLVLPDGNVLDESCVIMHWALDQSDPDQWYF